MGLLIQKTYFRLGTFCFFNQADFNFQPSFLGPNPAGTRYIIAREYSLKYHCMADLLFDWLGFDQTFKSVTKQRNKK